MTREIGTLALAAPHTARRAVDFVALTKPRVVAMVLATTLVGYHLGAGGGSIDYLRLALTLLGTGIAAGGTLALNQFMERQADACMLRTRGRPLPDGRLAPVDALVFGALLTAIGVATLAMAVGPKPALTVATTAAAYLLAYTPLKSRTPLSTLVGAVPGALPPVAGWLAAGGELGYGAWALFAILFLWQIPHALAISRLHGDDYARAGIRLLSSTCPDAASAGRLVVIASLALVAVSLVPTPLHMAGGFYLTVAVVLGAGLCVAAVRLGRSASPLDARRLLLATLVYLPLLLATLAVDKLPFRP